MAEVNLNYNRGGSSSAGAMYGSVKPARGRVGVTPRYSDNAINIESDEAFPSSSSQYRDDGHEYLINNEELNSALPGALRLGRHRSRCSKYTRNLVHSANVFGLVAAASLVALFMFLNGDFSRHGMSTSNSGSDSSSSSSYTVGTVKPHIVFILSDDQGMGDMDYDGSDFDGLMPAIRGLNEAGINLTSYYSASVCTPARSSLMTGKYASRIGMQHSIVMGTQPWGLPLSEKLLPQYLQDAGYNTYLIGKWHLGLYSTAALPNARGFNHSFGFYGGYQHPLSYFYEFPGCSNQTGCLPDMHRNNKVYHKDGQFTIYTFGDEVEDLIRSYDKDSERPFFLYLSPPQIHLPVHPDQDVMDAYEDELSSIGNEWRRKCGGLSIMLDKFVERVVNVLNETNFLDDTIIIYASDNGAQAEGSELGAGSNFPLRGSKGSSYEGANRVPAFIFSPLLGHRLGQGGGEFGKLFHVSDWLPTIMSGLLGRDDLIPLSLLDGYDLWRPLMSGSCSSGSGEDDDGSECESNRSQILYSLDSFTGIAAVRNKRYKLIVNESANIGWYDGENFGDVDFCYTIPTESLELYDLLEDEEERYNIYDDEPNIASSLFDIIEVHRELASPSVYCGYSDERAIEKWMYKDEVVPWMDDDEDFECPLVTTSSGACALISRG